MNEFERRKAGAEPVDTIDSTEIVDLAMSPAKARSMQILSHIVYGLFALAWFTGGVTGIVGVIIDYVKRTETRSTVFASHADWRIRTFWWTLLWAALATPLVWIWIGWPLLFLLWIWCAYRIIKGWLRLWDLQPV